jgi:hypothetical protein
MLRLIILKKQKIYLAWIWCCRLQRS